MAIKYVRPDTSHSGTRNGDSYATAYGGWSEVSWAALTAGSTLYVCGAHSYTGAHILIGAHGGTSGSPVTITGEYAADSGSIQMVGAYFVENDRPDTTLRNLTLSGGSNTGTNVLFLTAAAVRCQYLNNKFVANGGPALSFYAATGQAHSDILLQGNTFTGVGRSDSGLGACVTWYLSAAAITSSLTRLTIRDNLFDGFSAGRAVIMFRAVAATTPVMTDLVIENNAFRYTRGLCMEIKHRSDAWGVGSGVRVRFNKFTDCYESVMTSGMGGCIAIDGFKNSTTSGFGVNEVSYNTGIRVDGAVGGVNAFYGEYQIFCNYFGDLTTNTIDGNGILIDHGCDNVDAWGNVVVRAAGKAGVSNSGYVLMLLDSTNCRFSANVGLDCKAGIHIGAQSPAQSGAFRGNALANCKDFGVYLSATANRSGVSAYNNIVTGPGVAVSDQGSGWTAEDFNVLYGMAASTNHTNGAHNSVADPQFVDTTQPWLGLKPGSPCRSAGTYLQGARDRFGRRYLNPPNIGPWAVLPRP